MDSILRLLNSLLPFEFSARRLAILGLLLLITVLLLASWYRGPAPAPAPPPPDSGELGRSLGGTLPVGDGAAQERAAFAGVFTGIAADVARSRELNASATTPDQRGEYRTVEQVLRATRLANLAVLSEDRKAAWRPFFDALGVEIDGRYRAGQLGELEQVERLWNDIAAVLTEK